MIFLRSRDQDAVCPGRGQTAPGAASTGSAHPPHFARFCTPPKNFFLPNVIPLQWQRIKNSLMQNIFPHQGIFESSYGQAAQTALAFAWRPFFLPNVIPLQWQRIKNSLMQNIFPHQGIFESSYGQAAQTALAFAWRPRQPAPQERGIFTLRQLIAKVQSNQVRSV